MKPKGNPEPSKEEARKIFLAAFLRGGTVTYTKHATKRMSERKVDEEDLIKLAQFGSIPYPPEPHLKLGIMIYSIEKKEMNLRVPFAITNKKSVRIWSVILLDNNKK